MAPSPSRRSDRTLSGAPHPRFVRCRGGRAEGCSVHTNGSPQHLGLGHHAGSRCSRVVASAYVAPASASVAEWSRPATVSGPGTKQIPRRARARGAVNRRGSSIAPWGARAAIDAADLRRRRRRARALRAPSAHRPRAALVGGDRRRRHRGGGVGVGHEHRGGRAGAARAVQTRQILASSRGGFAPITRVDRRGDALVSWTTFKGSAAPGSSSSALTPPSGRRVGASARRALSVRAAGKSSSTSVPT
ncbi:MAG: hypothetical protein QOD83_431 [Solirubrobacteraceae bacterium]|nr:hypothetical protein [Solirubrobacteraceae bacterium]